MTRDAQLVAARRLATAAALAGSLCTAGLVADHAVARRRAHADRARVEALEQQVKADAQAAAALHQERKQQTDASRERDVRGRVLAWALLVAGAVAVGSGKWYLALRPQRLPSLDELVAARFLGSAARRAAPRGAAAVEAAVEPASDGAFVAELIERFGRGREAAIPILQAVQGRYRYLPDEVLRRVCERTEITPAQLAGSSSFYARFRRSPVGRHVVRVCHGTACHVAGAEQIREELRRHLGIPEGADTDPRRRFTLDAVACVGCCSLAPVMMIEDETAGRLTPTSARQAIEAVAAGS